MTHFAHVTDKQVADFIQCAHYWAFKKEITPNNAMGVSLELFLKGSRPVKYIIDYTGYATRLQHGRNEKLTPILFYMNEVCKRR